MTLSLTYRQFMDLDPCEDRARAIVERFGGPAAWGDTAITAAQARDAGAPFEDIFWAASRIAQNDRDVERRLRLWEADCAAHVLHVYERSHPGDARPRTAIAAIRAYARGSCARIVLVAARDGAWAAAWDAGSSAARDAVWSAAGAAEVEPAWASAWDAARAVGSGAAWYGERAWQFDRLVARLSDPEPADVPLPAAL